MKISKLIVITVLTALVVSFFMGVSNPVYAPITTAVWSGGCLVLVAYLSKSRNRN